MAQHGGLSLHTSVPPPPRPPMPRVHRPRTAMMNSSQLTNTQQQLSSSTRLRPQPTVSAQIPVAITPLGGVSLTAPRPDAERVGNEYVETPFRASPSGKESPIPVANKAEIVREVDVRTLPRRDPHHETLSLPIGRSSLHHHPHQTSRSGLGIVNKQPCASSTFKKNAFSDRSSSNSAHHAITNATNRECYRSRDKSIVCANCGQCRCDSCRQPRPLPSKWLCHNACVCSAEATLDYVTCVCCVKGLFYHCAKDFEMDRDGDGTACADSPCSCEPHRRFARWGCLGLLALALPCLWCYWPLKGCVKLCELGYARYNSTGCRCDPGPPRLTDLTPEKRLLDSDF